MRTLVAIPCMDMVHTDFLRSLMAMEKSAGELQFTFCQSSLIYDARNKLAAVAVDNGFDAVLWLDSDMVFAPDLLQRLSEHLELGRECVSGLYFTRKAPIRPVVYKDLRMEFEEGARWPTPIAENYDDYPRDDLFRIRACGFGAVMMTTALIRRVQERFGQPFVPASGWGEDLSFCIRAEEVGAELWCDSSIKLGHVGTALYDEDLFLAVSETNIKN